MGKLFYPVIFEEEENNMYSIYFPDLPECNSCGEGLTDAYQMAFDAIGITLSYYEDNNIEIPKPSNPKDIALEKNQFLVLVEFDMLEYKKKHDNRSIKKTLTIPNWLNEMALEKNINFSYILQEALKKELKIQ